MALQRNTNADHRAYRSRVDSDLAGPNKASAPSKPSCNYRVAAGQSLNFGRDVALREYVWKLEGLSWLQGWLLQAGINFLSSDDIFVSGEGFDLAYRPDGGSLTPTQNGTLAIRYAGLDDIAFRYSFYVKDRHGSFIQWGKTRDEFYEPIDEDGSYVVYGPDVHEPDAEEFVEKGIFGLTHEQLLKSKWVENDTLTVKLILEVRQNDHVEVKTLGWTEVPGPTLSSDMRAFWESGACRDVQFLVQGDTVHAHSQVLCARSEVFRKQLTAGMQESVSKVIVIDDCDPGTFKAFLKFLYTDTLDNIKKLSPNHCEDQSSSPIAQLQSLLAVSHKYQVKRLQLWCEMQLSEQMTISEVCGILCQAHLLEAKKLETSCLSYIKENMAEVVKLPAYAELIKTWPQVMLSISLFMAGVSESDAAAAVESLEKNEAQRKRKRADE